MVPAPRLLRASCPSPLRGRLPFGRRSNLFQTNLSNEFEFTAVIRHMRIVIWCSLIEWCRHQDSNSGPTDYKSVALPTELYRHWIHQGEGFYVLMTFCAMFLGVNFIRYQCQRHQADQTLCHHLLQGRFHHRFREQFPSVRQCQRPGLVH